MKYFTEQTIPFSKGQVFSELQDNYVPDPLTGLPILGEPINMQELIQSNADCELCKVLARFGIDPQYTSVEDTLLHVDDVVEEVPLRSDVFEKYDVVQKVLDSADVSDMSSLMKKIESYLAQQQQQQQVGGVEDVLPQKDESDSQK